MGADTGRDPGGLDQYWRRRAIALGGVIGAVGLLAWACAGDGGEEGKPLRNAAATAGPSPSGVPIPSAMPTVTVTATAKVTATPKPAQKPGDACDARDVVVTMAATRETYAAGEQPQFRLTAVNTGGRACTFDVGPRSLDVRVTSGSDRVWSSAQCDRGDGSSIQMLRRGIPYAATITWDRKRGSGRCQGKRLPVRPGTYVAKVHSPDKIKVRKQIFSLR
ncbi:MULTISPECIES: hypothetical protein [Actinomadura]|uniref:DUF4232 domain-containing protein n=1 Tax=Actinomadura yumaensis TaxID=111807 RepID=A0ABW2CFG0_9ACTN|nr:hypothetical protein [Actinomadura sp. J1-007]MWK35756.1 hypothetical protein [Actinomadura sp. J1-007]